MPKNIKKILIFFFATYLVIQSVGFLFLEPPMVSAASDIPQLTIPDLQIDIPGLAAFSQPADACVEEGEYMKCSINWLNEYISGIYKYGIGIVGILATVVMMFGGFLYLTAAGDNSKISEAKEWIKASLTGLVIAMSSFMILYQVNPELISLKPIKITMIKPIETATSTISASDVAARKQLADENITVNHENCPDKDAATDQYFGTDCTSLHQLPQTAIDGLINLKKTCNCTVVVTGGTEMGHQTHGLNIAIVDLRVNSSLNAFLETPSSQSISQTRSPSEILIYSAKYYSTPGFYYRENVKPGTIDHWHVKF